MSFYGDTDPKLNEIRKITDAYRGVETPIDLYEALRKLWCADTCAPRMREKWSVKNPSLGQCSITSFLVQDLFGGEVCGVLREGGNYHCYNVIGDCTFDLTSEQFGEEELSYTGNPVQSRDVHFAKQEKKERYELLKRSLEEYLKYASANTADSVPGRIEKLRTLMKDNNVSVCLFHSMDEHGSEYVADYAKVTEYFSGCTSDNAVLVVTASDACLWTDSRYFLSAAKELKGSGIRLMKSGEEGVPTVPQFLDRCLDNGMVLGYDGRFVGAERGAIYRNIASHKGAMVRGDFAPAEKIRENAPARPANPLWIMDGTYAGEDHAAKKEKVRKALNERGVSALLLSKLDDIMWFTNLRGSDISCNPVGLSYLIMEDDTVELFLQPESVTAEVRGYLNENGIVLKEYASFFEELKGRSFAGGVLADPKAVSDRMIEILSANAVRPQFGNSPTSFLKATKTEAELEQIRECYRNDSAVLCRFLFEVERDLGRVFMTEISLAEKLNDMRRKIPGFLDLSFETISACGPNAAIVHYEPKEETNAEIRPEGFYLVDSGGQYRNGTTDVTRTVPLGDLTQAMRRDFTLVAIANLRLLTAKFKYGCTGANLDMYARSPLWEDGLDFGHGTGHGIGFVLNVHEGPQNIAWRIRRGLTGAETVFEPGMIVSDEPGIYRAGEYGIRTESIVECIEDETNAFGRFLRFRPLTYVPISLKALDESLMDASDIRRLNDYHKAVYETISPLLESSEERKWLKEATAPIGQTAVSRKLTDS